MDTIASASNRPRNKSRGPTATSHSRKAITTACPIQLCLCLPLRVALRTKATAERRVATGKPSANKFHAKLPIDQFDQSLQSLHMPKRRPTKIKRCRKAVPQRRPIILWLVHTLPCGQTRDHNSGTLRHRRGFHSDTLDTCSLVLSPWFVLTTVGSGADIVSA